MHTASHRSKPRQYNEEEATSIAFWIEEMIAEDLEYPEDILASLRTGVDLCRLANALRPCIVSVIRPEGEESAHAANVQAYLDACTQLGVNSHDLFDPEELLQEDGDVQRILRNVVALERANRAEGLPRLAIVELCENERCIHKIEDLTGEVGSLKKYMQDKEEDNRELRQENHDLKDKIAEQEDALDAMRLKVQALERSHQESDEKYKLAMIDIQIVKQEYEDLQHRRAEHAILSPPASSPRSAPLPVVHEGNTAPAPVQVKRLSKIDLKIGRLFSSHKRNASSPDLDNNKKVEEMKKFIKEEKKKLKKQEKERQKKEAKLKSSSGGEIHLDGASLSDSSIPRMTRVSRSKTLSRLGRSKDSDLSDEHHLLKTLESPRKDVVLPQVAVPPAVPSAEISSPKRDRSNTAAPKLITVKL